MQRIARSVVMVINQLPRPHRIMLVSMTALTLVVVAWKPLTYQRPSAPVTATEEEVVEVQKSEVAPALAPETDAPMEQAVTDGSDTVPQDELDDKTAAQEYVISSGDTLNSIFNQYGLDTEDVVLLAAADKDLGRLNIGQQLSWTLDEEGDLQRLSWGVNRRETRIYELTDDGFKMRTEMREGEWVNSVLKGTVGNDFVTSAKDAGLTSAEISLVIKAMEWQLDFRKLKKDDEFSVFMSREILNGKREGSQLLGVRLRSAGKDYYAIRAEDGKFYDSNGTGLAKGFLRFPMSRQYRVSSNFNPRRLNPVTRRVSPHRGVDFCMPQGTPILSAGDGEVLEAKYNSTEGYYVTIRHGRSYTTRYMHLSKLLVKPGEKIKRGARIALSGNTGRSTGPHLHYEVWLNQQAVNPMTAKLPRTEGLTGAQRRDYLAQVQEVLPQLSFD